MPLAPDPRPLTFGVGVLIHKNGLFLVGKRSKTCKRGAGCWAFPGGHVEPNETIMDSVHREIEEETGLTICTDLDIEFCPAILGVSDHRPRENHISYWIYAEYVAGEPINKEPDKCEGWGWVDVDAFLEQIKPEGEQLNWLPQNVWDVVKRRMPDAAPDPEMPELFNLNEAKRDTNLIGKRIEVTFPINGSKWVGTIKSLDGCGYHWISDDGQLACSLNWLQDSILDWGTKTTMGGSFRWQPNCWINLKGLEKVNFT